MIGSPGMPRQVPRQPRPVWGFGSNPAIAFAEAATATTAANSAAQVPSGESLLLAPAGASQAGPRGTCRCRPGHASSRGYV